MFNRFLQVFVETSKANPDAILGTIIIMLLVQNSSKAWQSWNTQKTTGKILDLLVTIPQSIPFGVGDKVTKIIDKEVAKETKSMKHEMATKYEALSPIDSLPKTPIDVETLNKRFSGLQKYHKKGHLSGALYRPETTDTEGKVDFTGMSFDKIREKVWSLTADTNPMHGSWHPINLMEAEVITWCQKLFHGEQGGKGLITHGGSTSLLETIAMYVMNAHRSPGTATRFLSTLGLRTTKPEVIVPTSVHVSIDKFEEALQFKLVKVPVDPVTKKADVKAMEAAITMNTCLMIASAPSFPFGVMDPIEELGQVALKHGIDLHVDACLGGFINAFAEKAKFTLPKCDYSVSGVSSISADLHKFGEAPKGISIATFRKGLHLTTTQVFLNWMGGMYVTPGLLDGSRSGAAIALAWLTMACIAESGYVERAEKILSLSKQVADEIASIPGIRIPYKPEHAVLGLVGDGSVNIMLVASEMRKKGWEINIIQTKEQKADGFHFCFTSAHTSTKNFKEMFIQDLRDSVEFARNNPNAKPEGMAGVYGKIETGIDLKYFRLPFPPLVKQKMGEEYQNAISLLPEEKSGLTMNGR